MIDEKLSMELRDFNKSYSIIKNKDKIVLGLSGGPDSVFLFHYLLSIRDSMNIEFVCVHINHMIRGESADIDEKFVYDLCIEYGIELFSYRINVPKLSKDEKKSLEDMGREVRYEMFRKVQKEKEYNKIAVAQNMNDQAETMIMRIIRGSGIEGLGAIHPVKNEIIRPILCVKRAQIEDFFINSGLGFRIDETNLEKEYHRNKIRHILLPIIENEFNPNIVEGLYNTSKLLWEDINYFENELRKYEYLLKLDIIELNILKNMEYALLSRFLRKLIDIRVSKKDVGKRNLDELIQLIRNEKSSKVKIIKDIEFRIEYGNLLINKLVDLEVHELSIELELGLNVVDKRYINLEYISENDFKKENNKSDSFYFDIDIEKSPIIVRHRISGDRFFPFGSNGSKKLKDFLIDIKLSKNKRDEILIISTKNNDILLVDMIRRSNLFKINENSMKILKVTFGNID
jgi:tRNA(Ile)-lysidine synthase